MLRAWFSPIPLAADKERNGLLLPKVIPEDLSAIAAALRQSAKRLRETPVAEIAQKLELVARQWQRPDLPELKEALDILPKLLPFSQTVCKRAIDALTEQITNLRLLSLLDEYLGDHIALDEFVERGGWLRRKAFGADLAFLVLSGNIVGVGVWDIVFCLLCKTPVLVKPSSDEPILPTLFAQTLSRFAPELASSVAVIPFPSEREDLFSTALNLCDAVIVYGSDEVVQSVKQRSKAKTRVIERGHKFSVAIVAEDFTDDRTAELLALDIARFDQRGCLSPQICFVVGQGARDKGRKFGEMVAKALEKVSSELPPNLREGDKASIAQFRLTCQMLGAKVIAPSDASWTVAIWDGEQGGKDKWLKVSCSARVVHIVAVSSVENLLETLRPTGKFLQGVAVAMDEKLAGQIADALGQMGACRICPIGQLQTPPLEWSQDGKHLIAELVRWCDFEPINLPPKESGWLEIFRGDSAQAVAIRSALEQQGIPVDLESEFDPSNPTFPIQRVLIPRHYADEAKGVLEGLNDL